MYASQAQILLHREAKVPFQNVQTLLASKEENDVFLGALLLRTAQTQSDPHIPNLITKIKTSSSFPLLKELLATLRMLLKSCAANTLRDAIPKVLNILLVKSTLDALNLAMALDEFSQIASSFPSICKPFSKKFESLAVSALSSTPFPLVSNHAAKTLVSCCRISNLTIGSKNNSKCSSNDGLLVVGVLTETLFGIVKDLVRVNSTDISYTFKYPALPLTSLEGAYSAVLPQLLDRFNAFIQCHIFLFGSKGETRDPINPRLILIISSLVFDCSGNEQSKKGKHDAIYSEKLYEIMPVIVCSINRLLAALLLSLGQTLIPERQAIWSLARKSFAYSSRSKATRISSYKLLTTFLEVFGVNGTDSLYSGILEDAAADVALLQNSFGPIAENKTDSSITIAATKFLSAALTYTIPSKLPVTIVKYLFKSCIDATLLSAVHTVLPTQPAAITSETPKPNNSPAQFTYRNSLVWALCQLLMQCLQCHARDDFPYEWVCCGMRTFFAVMANCDYELRSKIENLVHAHSDVLFGYRPHFTRSISQVELNGDSEGAIKNGSKANKNARDGFSEFLSSVHATASAAGESGVTYGMNATANIVLEKSSSQSFLKRDRDEENQVVKPPSQLGEGVDTSIHREKLRDSNAKKARRSVSPVTRIMSPPAVSKSSSLVTNAKSIQQNDSISSTGSSINAQKYQPDRDHVVSTENNTVVEDGDDIELPEINIDDFEDEEDE